MASAGTNPIADLARESQFEHVFTTPIFSCKLRHLDALNAELTTLILAQERLRPSAEKSNMGGWQSAPDFLDWGAPPIAALHEIMRRAVEIANARLGVPPSQGLDFRLHAWAAVNRKGHYNTFHVHPMATWSGVYYVDAGDEPPDAPGALLEFLHPIGAAAMSFFPGLMPSARTVRPESGLIILFPSYLQHGVRMYQGERPRICVPFNAHSRQAPGA